MNILLLNQNATVEKLITLSVQKIGSDIEKSETLENVAGNDYDVVIVDHEVLADFDMDEAKSRFASAKFFLLQPKENSSKVEGFDYYVDKPFLPTELVETLSTILAGGSDEPDEDMDMGSGGLDDMDLDDMLDEGDDSLDSLDSGGEMELGDLDLDSDTSDEMSSLDDLDLDLDDLTEEKSAAAKDDLLGDDLEFGDLDLDEEPTAAKTKETVSETDKFEDLDIDLDEDDMGSAPAEEEPELDDLMGNLEEAVEEKTEMDDLDLGSLDEELGLGTPANEEEEFSFDDAGLDLDEEAGLESGEDSLGLDDELELGEEASLESADVDLAFDEEELDLGTESTPEAEEELSLDEADLDIDLGEEELEVAPKGAKEFDELEDIELEEEATPDLDIEDLEDETSVLNEEDVDEVKGLLEEAEEEDLTLGSDVDLSDLGEESEEEMRFDLGENSSLIEEDEGEMDLDIEGDLEGDLDIEMEEESSIEDVKNALKEVENMQVEAGDEDEEFSMLDEANVAEALGERVAAKASVEQVNIEPHVAQETVAAITKSVTQAVSSIPVENMKELLDGMELTIKISFPDKKK